MLLIRGNPTAATNATFALATTLLAAVNQLGIVVTGYYGDLGSWEDKGKVPSLGVGHLVTSSKRPGEVA